MTTMMVLVMTTLMLMLIMVKCSNNSNPQSDSQKNSGNNTRDSGSKKRRSLSMNRLKSAVGLGGCIPCSCASTEQDDARAAAATTYNNEIRLSNLLTLVLEANIKSGAATVKDAEEQPTTTQQHSNDKSAGKNAPKKNYSVATLGKLEEEIPKLIQHQKDDKTLLQTIVQGLYSANTVDQTESSEPPSGNMDDLEALLKDRSEDDPYKKIIEFIISLIKQNTNVKQQSQNKEKLIEETEKSLSSLLQQIRLLNNKPSVDKETEDDKSENEKSEDKNMSSLVEEFQKQLTILEEAYQAQSAALDAVSAERDKHQARAETLAADAETHAAQVISLKAEVEKGVAKIKHREAKINHLQDQNRKLKNEVNVDSHSWMAGYQSGIGHRDRESHIP